MQVFFLLVSRNTIVLPLPLLYWMDLSSVVTQIYISIHLWLEKHFCAGCRRLAPLRMGSSLLHQDGAPVQRALR